MAAPAAASHARFHPPFHARLPRSAWGIVVGLSALLLGTALVALAAGWIGSDKTRVSTYAVAGSLSGIQLDVRSGSVDVLGGGAGAVEVKRSERYSFGHHSRETRSVAGGTLRIASSCPKVVIGNCSSNYRLTVPDNVPVTIRTGSGSVHLAGFRGSATITTGSGGVSVDAFCGFGLSVRTGSGGVHATTACSPQQLALRSDSGNLDVNVPAGRYRVQASGNGARHVSGITEASDAPFLIQAASGSGGVSIKGAP